MLFSVIIYAYMNRIFSSRAIAQRCRHDLGFMYLAGNDTPDFRTLARFRKEKGAQFASLFAHVFTKARDIGLVSFGTCSIDGTKVYANASREKNTTIAALEETIRACIEAAEALDVKEDAAYGDAEDDRDPQLKTKAGRAQKRHALREKQRRSEEHTSELQSHFHLVFLLFFFNAPAPTDIYPLSLHDALPIYAEDDRDPQLKTKAGRAQKRHALREKQR